MHTFPTIGYAEVRKIPDCLLDRAATDGLTLKITLKSTLPLVHTTDAAARLLEI